MLPESRSSCARPVLLSRMRNASSRSRRWRCSIRNKIDPCIRATRISMLTFLNGPSNKLCANDAPHTSLLIGLSLYPDLLNGGFAFSAFAASQTQTPPVLSASNVSPIFFPSASNTASLSALEKNRRSHSLPSSFSFFLISRCSFSMRPFSALVASISPF